MAHARGCGSDEPRTTSVPTLDVYTSRHTPDVTLNVLFSNPKDAHALTCPNPCSTPFISFQNPHTGYTAEVLEESVTYASHAGREGSAVSLDDVKLAIAAKLETQFIRPTSVEELSGYAKLVNKKPLPQLMNRPGIHVAQTENLLSPNYQFFPRGFQMVEEGQRVVGGEGEDVQMGAGAEPAKEMSPPTAANEPTAMAKGGTVEFALGKRKK